VVNKKAVLGKYVNSKLQNSLGIIILIATVFLGLRGLDKVFGLHIF
jgi:Mn2+/Fe2+ NRAMP family transporter